MLNTFEKTKAHEDRRAAIQRQMEAMEAAASSRQGGGSGGGAGASGSSAGDSASGTTSGSSGARQRRGGSENVPAGSLETARRFLWDEDEEDVVASSAVGKVGMSAAAAQQNQSGSYVQQNMYNIGAGDDGLLKNDGNNRRGIFSGVMGRFASTRTIDIDPGHSHSHGSDKGAKKEYRPNCLTSLYLCFRHILVGFAIAMTNCWTWIRTRWSMAMGNGRGRRLCLLIAVVLVVVIPVAIFSPKSGSSSQAAAGGGTRAAPKLSVKQRHEILSKAIVESGLSEQESLTTKGSPQAQALEWITKEDKAQLDVNDPFIFQRYALAVFFYSTHGEHIYQQTIINVTQHNTIPPNSDTIDTPPLQGATQPNNKDTATVEDILPTKVGETTEIGDDLAAQPNWMKEDAWLSDKGYCSWYGIECHHRSGTSVYNTRYDANAGIILVNMTENNVRGHVPAELFRALGDLRWASFAANGFYGPLPSDIGGCTQLRYLSLANNFFTGQVPNEVFNLHNLDRLYLDGNYFAGRIPVGLGKMTNLSEYLPALLYACFYCSLTHSHTHTIVVAPVSISLYNNFFTGTIPAQIANLKNITSIYFDINHLTGTIPAELGQLTKLEDLRLRHNKFVGSVPKELGDLTHLEILYLDRNTLTGAIPTTFGQLTRLNELHMYRNKHSGRIPTELGNMKELDSLYLDNNHLSGGECELCCLGSDVDALSSV